MSASPRAAVTGRVAALFLLALLARLVAAATSGLYVDEAFGWFLSRSDLAWLITGARPDNNPPLWYFLFHPLARATRDGLLLRLPSAVLGAMTAPVCYLMTRRFGERVGLTSGLLVAVSYMSWLVDAQTRAYGLLTLLAAITLGSVLDADSDGRPPVGWLGLAVAAATMPLLHLLGWVVDVALLGAALQPDTPRRSARVACLGFGVAIGVAWMAYAASGSRSALHPHDIGSNGLEEAAAAPAVLTGLPLPLHWSGAPLSAGGSTAVIGLSILVTCAAAAGLSALATRHRREAVTVALFVGVPLAALAAGAAVGIQPYQNRYLVPLSSGLYMLLAAAAFPPARGGRPTAAATLVAAIAGVNLTALVLFPTRPALQNQDWVSAARWIEHREQRGDALVACHPYSLVGLDFYYHAGEVDVDFSQAGTMKIVCAQGYSGAEQFGITPAVLDDPLAARLRGRRVFLVLNQVPPPDQERIVRWFLEGWEITDTLQLRGMPGWGLVDVLELTPTTPDRLR